MVLSKNVGTWQVIGFLLGPALLCCAVLYLVFSYGHDVQEFKLIIDLMLETIRSLKSHAFEPICL